MKFTTEELVEWAEEKVKIRHENCRLVSDSRDVEFAQEIKRRLSEKQNVTRKVTEKRLNVLVKHITVGFDPKEAIEAWLISELGIEVEDE